MHGDMRATVAGTSEGTACSRGCTPTTSTTTNHTQRPPQTNHFLETCAFSRHDGSPKSCQDIVRSATWVVPDTSRRTIALLHESVVQQPTQVPIEWSGMQRLSSLRALADPFDDAVSMLRSFSQGQQDTQHFGFDRQVIVNRWGHDHHAHFLDSSKTYMYTLLICGASPTATNQMIGVVYALSLRFAT